MTLPRIFLPGDMEAGRRYKLSDEDRKYIRSVMRLSEGDSIHVFNGSGKEGEGIIEHGNDRDVYVKIVNGWFISPDNVTFTLAQSLPKSDKMDFILQKATELGVQCVIPFMSSRSVPKLDAVKAAARKNRWEKIVTEAARQCGRAHIPEITPVVSFSDMLKQTSADACRIIFWEEEAARDLKTLLRRERAEAAMKYFVVIGPEGGFAVDEIEQAQKLGFLPVSLGRHVLRTETAAIAVMAIFQYEKGEFFNVTGDRKT